MQFAEKLDTAWKLKSLHSIAVGLKQLHEIDVSHQDLKPSNVLLFGDESKIADIGRSQCKTIESPYDELPFTGDTNYAPPEILYDNYDPDWKTRTYATDCYLLGSMIVFYFAGISMTALLRKNLPDEISWDNWRGTFEEVKEYLLDSFQKSLETFSGTVNDIYLNNELTTLVQQLCYPLPQKRGHPKDSTSRYSKYSLVRFITLLDVLNKKAKYNLIKD
jgi:serine/threonine protein kinase